MSGYDWSNEDVYKLIEMFKAREALWNTMSEDYKNRHKKHEAWVEIANEFYLDKNVIEKKIRALVGQFNRECKHKSGAGAGDSSKWFAFKKLMFLKSKNSPRSAVDEGLQIKEEESCDSENTFTLNETEDTLTVNETSAKKVFVTPKPFRKRKQPEVLEDTTQQEAIKILKNIYETKKTNRDECEAFGEYVSIKLREIKNSYARNTAQHHINNILYNASIGQYDSPTNMRDPTTSSSCGYNYNYNSAPSLSSLSETSPLNSSRAHTSARPPSPYDFSDSSQDSAHVIC